MNRVLKKFKKITVKDLEKEYKVNFGVQGNPNISTYLKNQGLPSLGKFLEKIETNYNY